MTRKRNPRKSKMTLQPPPALVRMKRLATGLLLLALVVFVIATILQETAGDAWGFVRAAAEGAMVGALADWFAVTALFRRPLGLPIPHTAIVLQRKDEIGHRLAGFMRSHFLRYRVVLARVREARPAHRILDWLSGEPGSRWLAEQLCGIGAFGISTLDDRNVSKFLRSTALHQLSQMPAPRLLAELLAVVTRQNRHRLIIDRILETAAVQFEDLKPYLREHIDREIPWFAGFLRETAYRRAVDRIRRALQEIAADPDHPLRRQIDEHLEIAVFRLRADPDWQKRVMDLWQKLLEDSDLQQFTDGVWQEAKQRVGRQLEKPDSPLREAIRERIALLAASLRHDTVLLEKMERGIALAVVRLLRNYRHQITRVISEEVERWDAQQTSDLIETQIGSDLQWIRINGTVVGGMAGLVIYTVSHYLL